MICLDIQMECVKPERNRKAFYRLTAMQDLFGYKLTRHWEESAQRASRGNQNDMLIKREWQRGCAVLYGLG